MMPSYAMLSPKGRTEVSPSIYGSNIDIRDSIAISKIAKLSRHKISEITFRVYSHIGWQSRRVRGNIANSDHHSVFLIKTVCRTKKEEEIKCFFLINVL
jgi:hypothetical protein